MSCSKMSFPTPAVSLFGHPYSRDKLLDRVKAIRTQFGSGYTQHRRFLSIKKPDGCEEEYFIDLFYYTPDKHGKLAIAGGARWRVEVASPIESFQEDDEITTMPDGAVVRVIHCETAQEMLLESDQKECIATPFTTNDPFGFDSFTCPRGSDPRCVEYYVKCVAQTMHAKREAEEHMTPEDLYSLMETSPFVSPYFLNAVYGMLELDERFDLKDPEGLSKEELKQHKKDELAKIRALIKAKLSPADFKRRYLQALDLGLRINPHIGLNEGDSKPAYFKQIGNETLLSRDGVERWNNTSGLYFFMATLMVLNAELQPNAEGKRNPTALHLFALAGFGAHAPEVTPKDRNWGVGKDLEWAFTTAEGAVWLQKLVETNGAKANAYVKELRDLLQLSFYASLNDPEAEKRYDDRAFELLTTRIHTYEGGEDGNDKLGLIKMLAAKFVLGTELKATPGFIERAEDACAKIGLRNWRMIRPVVELEAGAEDTDPFDVCLALGDYTPPPKKMLSRTFSSDE